MGSTENQKQDKAGLRQRFLSRRQAVSQDQALAGKRQVCQRLRALDALAGTQHLAGYAARGRELDVRPFLQSFASDGCTIYLPRVTGPGQMVFCPVDDWEALRPGAFGIAEPTTEAEDTDCIAVFLVPGVAFDSQGARLGFGMGYYDRALPPVGQCLAVGVAYDWQVHARPLPTEDHDRPMDYVVTDRRVIDVGDHGLGA